MKVERSKKMAKKGWPQKKKIIKIKKKIFGSRFGTPKFQFQRKKKRTVRILKMKPKEWHWGYW